MKNHCFTHYFQVPKKKKSPFFYFFAKSTRKELLKQKQKHQIKSNFSNSKKEKCRGYCLSNVPPQTFQRNSQTPPLPLHSFTLTTLTIPNPSLLSPNPKTSLSALFSLTHFTTRSTLIHHGTVFLGKQFMGFSQIL